MKSHIDAVLIDAALPKRTCSVCKKSKSLTQFKRSARSEDGFARLCRSCSGTSNPSRKNKYREKNRQMCLACERVLELRAFAQVAWRPTGRDDICRSCRPILKLEKGLSRYQYEIDLSPEEVVACRLLAEARAAAIYQGVSFTLTWDWLLDHIEPWRCESSGRRLTSATRPHRGALPAMVARKNVLRGYTPRNCLIVARAK